MNSWNFADYGISEDPHDGLQDLLVHVDEDTDTLIEILAEFFVECPDCWHQFCAFWVDWRNAEIEEEQEQL